MGHKRRDAGPRYSTAVLHAASGMSPNTRGAWLHRHVLKSSREGYDLENLLRAAAGAELVRHGVASKPVRDYLLKLIVDDMGEQIGKLPEGPRYLVACPPPDPKAGGPLAARMMAAVREETVFVSLATGSGALSIAVGLSADELRQHFAVMAASGDVATFVLDTAGLLRRTLSRLRAAGGEEPRS